MSSTADTGLKKHRMSVSTVVFMVFCLCAAGAYGIEDMVPQAGPGLTLVMLIVLPFLWSAPMGLVASELGSAIPEEGGFYKWVQRACGEFWGFQAGWWRTVSIYVDNTIYVVLAGSYLSSVVPMTPVEEYAFKASMVVFFTYINIRGIRDVGFVSGLISTLVPFMIYNLSGTNRELFLRGIPWIVTAVLLPWIWKKKWQPMSPFLILP